MLLFSRYEHWICSAIPPPEHCVIVADSLPPDPYVPNTPPCFDVAHVMSTCETVHLKLTVNFILPDDCSDSGGIATGHTNADGSKVLYSAEQAIILAEQTVNELNAFIDEMNENEDNGNTQWNSDDHSLPPGTHQCLPIQFVLTGINFHCSSDVDTVTSVSNLSSLQPPGPAFDVFVSDFTRGGGAAYIDGTLSVVDQFRPGNWLHELLHNYDLLHVFEFNYCENIDTWGRIDWTWDSDGDGIIDMSGEQCWDSSPGPKDSNGDPIWCDNDIYPVVHPCCDWNNQNNNVMAYSAWGANSDYAALTPCQIERTLNSIASRCDLVADVGSCPPPSAFIINDPSKQSDCGMCFDLRGSFNETYYQVTIQDDAGTVLYTGAEINRSADRYCVQSRRDKYGNSYWPAPYVEGDSYTVTLTVWNDCGDASTFSQTFILPPPCGLEPSPAPVSFRLVDEDPANQPNPATELTLSVTGSIDADFDLYLTSMQTGNQVLYAQEHFTASGGDKSFLIDISTWDLGYSALSVVHEGGVESFQFYR